MASKLKLQRKYAGYYLTRNAFPQAAIEQETHGWRVSYGDYSSVWKTLSECRDLLQQVAGCKAHRYPIAIA